MSNHFPMRRSRILAALALLLLPGTVSASWTARAPGIPANVISQSFQKETRTFPALDAAGEVVGTTTWRFVRSTGNCCENHLGATASGRLIDFGGTFLNFSDDKGLTWKQVRPIEPFVGGEGTVTVSPSGDIVAIAWDVYSGDQVVAFKMDATTGAWSYQLNPIHTPVFDREWVAMIPRFGTGTGTELAPWASVLRGGWPSKDVWYYSLDGLSYTIASNKNVGGNLTTIQRWLPTTPEPSADWTQPISASSVSPLNGGGALAAPADLLDGFFGNGWMILESGNLRWSRFRLGDGTALPDGRLVMDSLGRVHLVDASGGQIEYRMSADGGRTWTTAIADLPPGDVVENWDFRANGALGTTIVGVHAHKQSGTDQDYLLTFDTTCGAPEHLMTHVVGAGNLNASSGLGAAIRFDFATVALLPNGTPATSFMDQAHQTPTLALALGTEPLDPEKGLPQPSC